MTSSSSTNRNLTLIDTSVGSVMAKEISTIESGEPLREAVSLMKKSGLGCVVVLEDGKPAGIFTEKDLIRKVAEGPASLELPMKQVMSKPLTVVSPSATLWDAISLMGRRGIRRLPVVDKEKLVGILTEADVLRLVLSHQNLLLESVSESIPAGTREQLRSLAGHFELERPPSRVQDNR